MSTLAVSEKDFQAQLMEMVNIFGGKAYHAHDSRREVTQNGQRMLVGDKDARGFPDLTIVMRGGRLIFAELKSKKGHLSDYQREWLEVLPGHWTYLWRPVDWDDAVRIIKTGHRASAGMIQDADGNNVQPLQVLQPEATCIACQFDKP